MGALDLSPCQEINDVAVSTFLLLTQIKLGSGAGDADSDGDGGVADDSGGGGSGGGSGGSGGFLSTKNSTFSTGESKENQAFNSYIIIYVFLGVLAGFAILVFLYKIAQNFSGEIKPKNTYDDNIDCHAISQFIDKSPLATPTRSAALEITISSSHLTLPHLLQESRQSFGSTHSLSAATPLAADQDGIPPSLSFQDVTASVFTDPLRGDGYLPPLIPALEERAEI